MRARQNKNKTKKLNKFGVKRLPLKVDLVFGSYVISLRMEDSLLISLESFRDTEFPFLFLLVFSFLHSRC